MKEVNKLESILTLKGRDLIKFIDKDIDPHGFLVSDGEDTNFEVYFENEEHVVFTQIGNCCFLKRICKSLMDDCYYTHIELILEVIESFSPYERVFKRKLNERNIEVIDINSKCKEIIRYMKENKCIDESSLYEILGVSDEHKSLDTPYVWDDFYKQSGRLWEEYNVLSFWYPEGAINRRDIDKIIELYNLDPSNLIITFFNEESSKSHIKLYEEVYEESNNKMSGTTPAVLHTIAAKKRSITGFGSQNTRYNDFTPTQYWQAIQTSD